MPKTLKLSLLGLPHIELDGKVVELKRRRAVNLLAYLALYQIEHPRERLAAEFWGDSDSESARLSLRVTINDLRKGLGEETFTGGRDNLGINPQVKVEVDALQFQELAKSTTPSDWQKAAELYRDDFLPDMYDAWALDWRDRLSQIHISNLLQLAAHYRVRAEYGRAIEFAQKILLRDPSNESAHQQIMVCFEALGDRSAVIKQYESYLDVLKGMQGTETSLQINSIYERVQKSAQHSSTSLTSQPTNLPTRLTSFIGRETELETIENYLSPVSHDGIPARLVTLTGAGGSGKTSLSIQAASELVDTYEHGVWWVELASLTREQDVLTEIAHVLGIKESPELSIQDALFNKIRGRHLLLILDNCEHLIQACASLAADILRYCTRVQIMATSREPLGIIGEQVHPVPTMELPETDPSTIEEALQIEAVRLFTERARSITPSFQLDDENLKDVVSICRRLDGIPLAIELAASRMKSLSPSDLSSRLDDRFKLLTSGDRSALPRQKTLHALIDWSYNLLDEEEKTLFRRLSILPSGCTLEAAEALGSDLSTPVVELVNRLVEKSLLIALKTEADTRYRMLDSIRYFGLDLFKLSNESDVIMNWALEFFAKLVDEMANILDVRVYDAYAFQTVYVEQDNLRELLDWSLANNPELAMRLAGGLGAYWQIADQCVEGEAWLARALEAFPQGGNLKFRARALSGAGTMAFQLGKSEKAIQLHNQAFEIYRQNGDKNGEAFSLNNIGVNYANFGYPDEALQYLEKSLALARQIDDQKIISFTTQTIGTIMIVKQQYPIAEKYLVDGLKAARNTNNATLISALLNNLGDLYYSLNKLEEAFDCYSESEKFARKSMYNHIVYENKRGLARILFKKGDAKGAAIDLKIVLSFFHNGSYLRHTLMSLQWLGICHAQMGYLLEAVSLFGTVFAVQEEYQLSMLDYDVKEYYETLETIKRDLTPHQFNLAWDDGCHMPLDKAIEMALALE